MRRPVVCEEETPSDVAASVQDLSNVGTADGGSFFSGGKVPGISGAAASAAAPWTGPGVGSAGGAAF